mmetsp:Transcript_2361/g.5580  ORF Transcript_2361/g.5580 Transcript_2361/m.5580 type:complete len:251 (+) Transcript_2361:44-796(+)
MYIATLEKRNRSEGHAALWLLVRSEQQRHLGRTCLHKESRKMPAKALQKGLLAAQLVMLSNHQFTAVPSVKAVVSCHHHRGTSKLSPGPKSTMNRLARASVNRGNFVVSTSSLSLICETCGAFLSFFPRTYNLSWSEGLYSSKRLRPESWRKRLSMEEVASSISSPSAKSPRSKCKDVRMLAAPQKSVEVTSNSSPRAFRSSSGPCCSGRSGVLLLLLLLLLLLVLLLCGCCCCCWRCSSMSSQASRVGR